MAWTNPDDLKKSEWNSASYKMKRLDEAYSELNNINKNLKAFNPYGTYNFELKKILCDNIFNEVESKLTNDEKKVSKKFIEGLENFMKQYKIIIFKRKNIYDTPQPNINEKIYPILMKYLSAYELLVRDLIDVHGMDTAYGEDDEGL